MLTGPYTVLPVWIPVTRQSMHTGETQTEICGRISTQKQYSKASVHQASLISILEDCFASVLVARHVKKELDNVTQNVLNSAL